VGVRVSKPEELFLGQERAFFFTLFFYSSFSNREGGNKIRLSPDAKGSST
jgi:hypothetical protein